MPVQHPFEFDKRNDMKRFDPAIVFGVLLLVGGGLALAQAFGLLENASSLFWGGLFLTAGAIFLSLLVGGHWWASFPGFTLAALGALILLPQPLQDAYGGAIFLGGISLSFWYVYFTSRLERWWAVIPGGVLAALAVMIVATRQFEQFGPMIFLGGIGMAFFILYLTDRAERWWALIPAGVLITLAGTTVAADRYGDFKSGGFFFLGLAATFLMVAVFAGMRWAYWPALALGVMGFLGLASLFQLANYIWALVLIGAGAFVILQYFRRRD